MRWLCATRRRVAKDRCRSDDEGDLNHSLFMHSSKVGRSDERVDRHCPMSLVHSERQREVFDCTNQKSNSVRKLRSSLMAFYVTRHILQYKSVFRRSPRETRKNGATLRYGPQVQRSINQVSYQSYFIQPFLSLDESAKEWCSPLPWTFLRTTRKNLVSAFIATSR